MPETEVAYQSYKVELDLDILEMALLEDVLSQALVRYRESDPDARLEAATQLEAKIIAAIDQHFPIA